MGSTTFKLFLITISYYNLFHIKIFLYCFGKNISLRDIFFNHCCIENNKQNIQGILRLHYFAALAADLKDSREKKGMAYIDNITYNMTNNISFCQSKHN